MQEYVGHEQNNQEFQNTYEPQREKSIKKAPVSKAGQYSNPILQMQSKYGNRATSQFFNSQYKKDNSNSNKGGGLPTNLKENVESLSGLDVSDVNVHYNSRKPSEIGALAYAEGGDIFLGPGQEEHLPHETWHVVQQKQGRVNQGIQKKDKLINIDHGLEQEADIMGHKIAAQQTNNLSNQAKKHLSSNHNNIIQPKLIEYNDFDEDGRGFKWEVYKEKGKDGEGYGTSVNDTTDMKTKITWKKDGDKKIMIAKPLGPDHGLGTTPSEGTAMFKRARWLEERTSMKYITGHLLNENLGGPGNKNDNLTPIPDDVNKEHEKQAEKSIKKIVNEKHGWVYYKVVADESGKDTDFRGIKYTKRLDCEWFQIDKDHVKEKYDPDDDNDMPKAIEGTKGKKTFDIPAPSTYLDLSVYKDDPDPNVLAIPLGQEKNKLKEQRIKNNGGKDTDTSKEGNPEAYTINEKTAISKLSYKEVVLTKIDDLKFKIKPMRELVNVFNRLKLSEGILEENVEIQKIIKQLTESLERTDDEKEAYEKLEQIKDSEDTIINDKIIEEKIKTLREGYNHRKGQFHNAISNFNKLFNKEVSSGLTESFNQFFDDSENAMENLFNVTEKYKKEYQAQEEYMNETHSFFSEIYQSPPSPRSDGLLRSGYRDFINSEMNEESTEVLGSPESQVDNFPQYVISKTNLLPPGKRLRGVKRLRNMLEEHKPTNTAETLFNLIKTNVTGESDSGKPTKVRRTGESGDLNDKEHDKKTKKEQVIKILSDNIHDDTFKQQIITAIKSDIHIHLEHMFKTYIEAMYNKRLADTSKIIDELSELSKN